MIELPASGVYKRLPRGYNRSMNKDMKQLIRKVERQGGEVRISPRGHVLFNKDGRRVAVGAGTPSDSRSWKNLLADLRRAGFDV